MSPKKIELPKINSNSGHCHHPSLKKEFVHGMPTGSYLCTHCGAPLATILQSSSH